MNFVTPITKHPLLQKDYATLTCQESGVEYYRVDGVWRMIAAERLPLFEQFIREYETVRLAEGRQAADAGFYRQLPHTSPNHPTAAMWRQRQNSFQTFSRSLLSNMEKQTQTLDILDLGAGNGWLSNRLAERGHRLTAVDLTVNDFDGLGVHPVYENRFTPVQAEFDHLPFEAEQFDLALFNASLHYSTDYAQTLAEALRVTQSSGRIAIIDTPVYQNGASGRQMVAERERQFSQQHGFKSNSLNSENFLSTAKIEQLKTALNLDCHVVATVAPFRQAVRRLKTRAKGQREAAEFPILIFTKPGVAL